MAMKSLRKMNAKLQFLYGQNEFVNSKLCRRLCNSLIQLGYTYINFFVSLRKKYRFLNINLFLILMLNLRQYKGTKEFKEVNWVPILNIGKEQHNSI